jgi:cell division protein FtsL
MSEVSEKRRGLIEREVERLKGEQDILDRDWRRIPFLGGIVVLALPAYLIWGPIAAIYAVLFAPCLVITALYLVGVRRAENRQSIAELERQLAER